MARRLTPEARRAEIIEVARTAITEDGYRSLSLRGLARRCGMSAPGVMHYFPDMPALLEAVLDHRDETDLAAIIDARGPDVTLVELFDAARAYYVARSAEVRNFDTLEAEALDPNHPAHDYFVRRTERTFEQLRPYIDREFENPGEVGTVVRLLLDGSRVARLRSPALSAVEQEAGWRAIQDVLDRYPRRGGSEPNAGRDRHRSRRTPAG
ncbi:TetR/AcrR family transcriptional regulator [Streptomyces niveus]|uniref:TetR/AcrR family transcriptional regulator n=1 Tax=Streptomyces niveus TaxID=193462 RepID=UPI0036B7E269